MSYLLLVSRPAAELQVAIMKSLDQEQSSRVSEPLDTRLNRHFLACSAFVGTAVLMTGSRAAADIVYSGLQNISVPTTNGAGGIYLDLTLPGLSFTPSGSGLGPAEGLNTLLPGWDANFYRSGSGNLRWYYNTGAVAVFNGTSVAALAAGVTVDASSALGTFQALNTEFTGVTAFMGVRFLDAGSNPVYGWIRVNGGPTQGFPATIVDWAYESSGAGIQTGAVPEPSSLALGCLAAGAAGVSAWRRRKTA